MIRMIHTQLTGAAPTPPRHLLVTAGEDRLVKVWDLRRLHHPVTSVKRFLTNEICWLLNATGFMMAQENAYVA